MKSAELGGEILKNLQSKPPYCSVPQSIFLLSITYAKTNCNVLDCLFKYFENEMRMLPSKSS